MLRILNKDIHEPTGVVRKSTPPLMAKLYTLYISNLYDLHIAYIGLSMAIHIILSIGLRCAIVSGLTVVLQFTVSVFSVDESWEGRRAGLDEGTVVPGGSLRAGRDNLWRPELYACHAPIHHITQPPNNWRPVPRASPGRKSDLPPRCCPLLHGLLLAPKPTGMIPSSGSGGGGVSRPQDPPPPGWPTM